MTSDHRERELTLAVPDEWELGDAARFAPSGGRAETRVVELVSTYFDTAEHDLLRAGCTLRRRTGDIDEGWQLKVPDGDARLEIGTPLGSRGVPPELRALTAGLRSGAALRRVAVVRTRRQLARLYDRSDACVAEVALDEVDAAEFRELAITRRWRELEVELVDGGRKRLAAIERRLESEGASRAEHQSKLARALDAAPRATSAPDSLAGLVRGYLETQYAELVRGDVGLRRGEDSVHVSRVAIRRYRSVLREFPGLFDDARRRHLDAELRAYAATLGEVRDRHVVRTYLDARLDAIESGGTAPDAALVGGGREAIHRRLDAELDAAQLGLTRRLRSRRHAVLLRELADWRADPPVVDDDVPLAVAAVLDHVDRRARKRRRRAGSAEDSDAALHAARKAAKRARYVAELAAPVLSDDADAVRRRAKRWQRRLGDHQDAVVAGQFLRRLVGDLAPSERAAFAIGVLYAGEPVPDGAG